MSLPASRPSLGLTLKALLATAIGSVSALIFVPEKFADAPATPLGETCTDAPSIPSSSLEESSQPTSSTAVSSPDFVTRIDQLKNGTSFNALRELSKEIERIRNPDTLQSIAASAAGIDSLQAKFELQTAIARAWILADSDGALSWFESLPNNQEKNFIGQNLLNSLATSDPEAALALAPLLNPSTATSYAQGEIRSHWLKNDPAGAIASHTTHISSLSADELTSFIENAATLVPHLITPELATKLPNQELLSLTFEAWIEQDRTAALQWLSSENSASRLSPSLAQTLTLLAGTNEQ